jgi:hypothetical protein
MISKQSKRMSSFFPAGHGSWKNAPDPWRERDRCINSRENKEISMMRNENKEINSINSNDSVIREDGFGENSLTQRKNEETAR